MACSCIEWIVALLVWRSGRTAGTCLSCHEGNRYPYVAPRETRVLALFANPISTLIGGRLNRTIESKKPHGWLGLS